MADAPGENRCPQDEEEIADDRSGKGSFDDTGQPFAQRHQTNDEFRRIAKRRVEKAADARTGAVASCSVARPIQPANGTIAIAATTKRRVSFRHAGTYRSAIAIGTASSSKSSGVSDQLDFRSRGMLHRSLASAIAQATLSLQASSNLRYAQSLRRKLVNRTIAIIATVDGCAVKLPAPSPTMPA